MPAGLSIRLFAAEKSGLTINHLCQLYDKTTLFAMVIQFECCTVGNALRIAASGYVRCGKIMAKIPSVASDGGLHRHRIGAWG